jgi:Ca2+-binding EF-hand superfamily protein
MSKEQFLSLYENFFPFGDSTAFSGLLFRLYDTSASGSIDFGEFLAGLSITTRGRMEEKVQWAFKFYDFDGDGVVSRSDMMVIVDAVYRMMGTMVELPEDEDTPGKRVEKLFRVMGKEESERLSLEDFREGVKNDPTIVQALLMYDGVA